MKHFKVCINYGRKCAAYETIVTAATEADAKHQAKVLFLCVVLMLQSKNNSTGVLIVQTVILLAVLAMCLIITFELWQSNKRLKRCLS